MKYKIHDEVIVTEKRYYRLHGQRGSIIRGFTGSWIVRVSPVGGHELIEVMMKETEFELYLPHLVMGLAR